MLPPGHQPSSHIQPHQQQQIAYTTNMYTNTVPQQQQQQYYSMPQQQQLPQQRQLPVLQQQTTGGGGSSSMLDLVPKLLNQAFQVTPSRPHRPRYYSKSVLTKESQFSYKNGSNSCTYCSLEACLYELNGLIFADDPTLPDAIRRILIQGVGLDQSLGLTSCDEVFELTDRYKKYLQKGNIVLGKLRDSDVLNKLLASMTQKSSPENNWPTVGVILTKPPETIALFYQPKQATLPFVIFDSHPRGFEPDKGAGFYFFTSAEKCRQHLEELYRDAIELAQNPLPSTVAGADAMQQKLAEYEAASRACFDATFMSLNPANKFDAMSPSIEPVPSSAVSPRPQVSTPSVVPSVSPSPVPATVQQVAQAPVSNTSTPATTAVSPSPLTVPAETVRAASPSLVETDIRDTKIFTSLISDLRAEIERLKDQLQKEQDKNKVLSEENALLREQRSTDSQLFGQLEKLLQGRSTPK